MRIKSSAKAIKIDGIKIRDAKKTKCKVIYRVEALRKLRQFLRKELMVELTNSVDVSAVTLPMYERGLCATIDEWTRKESPSISLLTTRNSCVIHIAPLMVCLILVAAGTSYRWRHRVYSTGGDIRQNLLSSCAFSWQNL